MPMRSSENYLYKQGVPFKTPSLMEALEDMVLHGLITNLDTVLWGTAGSGGLSLVHSIRQTEDEAGWAIKFPRPQYHCSEIVLWHLAKERGFMKRVMCAPRLHELVRQHHGYILMEYIEGATLSDLREKLLLTSLESRTAIAKKVTNNLLEIENAGLLHCDVKPHNIMQRENGETVVVDFHSAKEKKDQHRDLMKRGTAQFLSMERLQGIVSSAGEVYGLGKTFFVSLFPGTVKMIDEKSYTYNRQTVYAAIDAVVTDTRWNALLKCMLEPDVRYRISLQETAAELRSILVD